jgi:hypothetical protein
VKKVSVVFCLLVCIGSAQGQWQLTGFSSRSVECVAQHPQDTSIILAAVADSLFHSTDGGSSWSFLTHFSPLPVYCVMYDPDFCDTVYALLGNGSYSDGIYRSTDGGHNWSVLEWFLYPRCMLMTYERMLVGCDGSGVHTSTDGGGTWQAWNDGLTDLHVFSMDYSQTSGDSAPCYGVGTAHGFFYRAVTGWIQASGVPTDLRVSSISFHHSQPIFFATITGGSWSDGIYRAIDLGNWQVVDWWIYPSCVAVNPLWPSCLSDTCGIFAGDSGLGIKYSSDWGTTWQEMNSGLGNMFVNSLSYHPQDSMRLFAATQGGLYRFQYSPGVVERMVDEYANLGFRVPTVVRAGAYVPLMWLSEESGNASSCWIKLYDAAGRLKRAELLGNTPTALTPLEHSGVYFLEIGDQNKQHRQKIIVVD